MSRISAMLRASLESVDGEQFDIVTPETTTEIEATLIELDETHDEAREAVEVVEELEARHEQVEELEEALESFNANGGMSQDAAKLYQMRLSQLTAGLESMVPVHHVSLESFGSSNSRMAASLEQKEATAGAKNGIWQAILRFARAAKDAIVNFLGRLLTSNAGLKKKVAAIKQRASALKGDVAGSTKKIGTGTWSRNLTDSNGNVGPTQTAAMLKDLSSSLTQIQVAVGQSASNPEGGVDTIVDKLAAIKDKLPGSYTIEATDSGFAIQRKEVKNPEEIEVMNNKQVVATMTACEELMRSIEGFSKNVKGSMSKLESEIARFEKSGQAADGKEKEVRKTIANVRRVSLELPKIASDVVRAALVYANKSLSGVSQTKEEAAAAGKVEQASLKDAIMGRRTAPAKK